MNSKYDNLDPDTREIIQILDSKIEELIKIRNKEKIIWFTKETDLRLNKKTESQIKKEKENSQLHSIEKEINKYKARRNYRLERKESYKQYRERSKQKIENQS